MKPPFLYEADAISDVLNSISEIGSKNLTHCISINPVHIQKFTLVEYLFERGEFRPPWLWSVIEALKRGHKLLQNTGIRLLSSPTAAGTTRGAHNCKNCDGTVLQAINEFSMNNDSDILNNLYCDCYNDWLDVINLENCVKSIIEPIPKDAWH